MRRAAGRRRMDRPGRRRQRADRPHSFLLTVLAAVFAAEALLVGGRALYSELRTTFRDAPPTALPPPFRKQAGIVMREVPAGASVLHLSPFAESWYSRMWQRALYPRNTVFLLEAGELDCASLRQYRERHRARFAISVGDPWPGTGYLWSVPMGPMPGSAEDTWFGELAP